MDSIMTGLKFGIVSGVIASIFVLLWALMRPRIYCPECGEPLPRFRKPKTKKQALWGDCTCPKCGCEIDRKGRKVKK